MRKFFIWVGLVVMLGLLGGCASDEVRHMPPRTDLAKFKRVFVETANNDSNHLDEVIVAELKRLGYEASSGARTMAPDDAQLRILYDGQWTWDFRTYLIEISMTVREAHSDRLFATGRHFHPGVTKKEPAILVRELLGKIFGQQKG